MKKNSLKRTWSILVIFILEAGLLWAAGAAASDVTLGWEPNKEANLEGYAVYVSNKAKLKTDNLHGHIAIVDLEDPEYPNYTITGLEEGINYYIAVKAYNAEGSYSAFSTPICLQVTQATVGLCTEAESDTGGDSTGNSSSGGGGGGGGGCFIAASMDNREDIGLMPFLGILCFTAPIAILAYSKARKQKRHALQ